MQYKLKENDLIKLDIVKALDYYDSISFELGERFEQELCFR